MKLIDARKEVLVKLGARCGFEVPENRLSGETRQQITALASSYRQLFALRELVQLERATNARFSAKAKRRITNKKDIDLSENLKTIEAMRGVLDKKISEVAARIVVEANWRPGLRSTAAAAVASIAPGAAPRGPAILEPIRCPRCGADMGMPTSSVTKCKYCGTEYSVSSYLQSLGAEFSPPPAVAPVTVEAQAVPVQTDVKLPSNDSAKVSE